MSPVRTAVLRTASIVLLAVLWTIRVPTYHRDLASRAAALDRGPQPHRNNRSDPVARSSAVLLLHSASLGEGLAAAFAAGGSRGVFLVTAAHVPEGLDSLDAFVPALMHGVRGEALPVRPAYEGGGAVLLAGAASSALKPYALPLAPADPVPGEAVFGVLAVNSAHPKRMDAAEKNPDAGAFSAVVDVVGGQTVIYCLRCEEGDSGAPLVDARGDVVGLIDGGRRWLLMQDERHLPDFDQAGLVHIVPASAIRALLDPPRPASGAPHA